MSHDSEAHVDKKRTRTRRRLLVVAAGFLSGLALAFLVYDPSPASHVESANERPASRPAPATPRPTSPPAADSVPLPPALARDPDLRLAMEARRQGQLDQALTVLQRVHQRHPSYPEPLIEVARIQLFRKEIRRALDACDAAIRVAPKDARCHLLLGEVHEAAGENDRAERSYLLAAQYAPHDPDPLFRLGLIADARGHEDVATEYYRRSLEVDSSYPPAAHHLATQYAKSGKFKEAIQLLQAALRREPENPSIRLNLAHTYLQADDPENAVKEFRTALVRVPEMAEPHYFLGYSLELLGREREAQAAFHAALERDPYLHRAWYSLARLLGRQGEKEASAEALRQFERARELTNRISVLRGRLAKQPRNVAVLVELGEALIERRKPREAVARLKRALDLAPRHPDASRLLEKAQEALGAGQRP